MAGSGLWRVLGPRQATQEESWDELTTPAGRGWGCDHLPPPGLAGWADSTGQAAPRLLDVLV